MKAKIDFKSVLIGMLAGIVVMLGVGAGVGDHQIGRYQATVGNGHGLIIDTTTGQAWQCYLGTESGGSTDSGFFRSKLPESK